MKHEKEGKIPFSEKIDRLITHKILGLPIFLAVMFYFSGYVYVDWYTFI